MKLGTSPHEVQETWYRLVHGVNVRDTELYDKKDREVEETPDELNISHARNRRKQRLRINWVKSTDK